MVRKRNLVICLAVVWGVLSFICLSGDARSADVKKGGTLTVAMETKPTEGWDPQWGGGNDVCWFHHEQIYESLIRFSPKMELVPVLATSWEWKDKKTLIFHLRKGVKFHNGREFEAEDVKYSFERMKKPEASYRTSLWTTLKSVEVLDKYTVQFNLTKQDVTILSNIAWNRFTGIGPRELLGDKVLKEPKAIGTGPFLLKEYVPGDYTIFERNPNYWDKNLPYLDKLKFVVIKDETSRLAALRRGTVDLAWLKDPQLAKMAEKSKNLRVVMPPMSRQTRIFLTHDRFPFNNKKLRQAVSAAVDRDAFVKTAYLGYAEVSASLPSSMMPYAVTGKDVRKLPYYERDLEQSKRLMKEAGYPDGFEFDFLWADYSPDMRPLVQTLKSNLADVGIKVNLKQMEWGILLNRWKNAKYQMLYISTAWFPHPDFYLRTWFHSKARSNTHKYYNPRVDELLDQSLVTLDQKKRIEIWKELQQIVQDDVAILWTIAGPNRIDIQHDYIKGYEILPSCSRVLLREAWKDK